MKANIKKLRVKIGLMFVPVAKRLRAEGMDDNQILNEFRKFVMVETQKFYRGKATEGISSLLNRAVAQLEGADSKIEVIYYDKLKRAQVPFKFQYKIGPYRADFLIGESLVFEIDGPHHRAPDQKAHDRRRDAFIREFGYRVMRVPAWVAAMDPDAVIEEIKGVI